MKIIRTRFTQEQYNEYIKRYTGDGSDHFADWQNRLIKEYKHWAIVKNLFPYDNIATVSHILITKRVVEFDWEKLSRDEQKELNRIKKDIRGKYDCILENLPTARSIPKHFHLHLLKIKDY